jgi:condensin complex subunit 2
LNEIVLGDGMPQEEEDQYDSRVKGAPNFQRASVTIDASMKIYATRVDSVHTATLHIAGGIEEFEREEAAAAEAAVEEEPQGGNARNRQRGKHSESGVNTLEAST